MTITTVEYRHMVFRVRASLREARAMRTIFNIAIMDGDEGLARLAHERGNVATRHAELAFAYVDGFVSGLEAAL